MEFPTDPSVLFIAIYIMAEYKDGRGNTSQDHGGMPFHDRVYLLEAEFLIVVRIILESVLIAIEPVILLTNVGSCMANLPSLLELPICLVVLNHLLHMTLILLILTLMNL